MLGAFIGCAVGVFLIMMISPVKALIFIGIFLVVQQLEGNLIYPKVVGNSVGLPSIWVLVAVSVGGSMMGILGMLMFIPIVSTLYVLLKEDVNRRNKEQMPVVADDDERDFDEHMEESVNNAIRQNEAMEENINTVEAQEKQK
jgi:predicted PurR-regulated permease PerM